MSSNTLNNIPIDDENFLKNFSNNFYRQIIRIENYNNFEDIIKDWVKEFFEYNKKDSEIILNLIKHYEEYDNNDNDNDNENWIFSSIIGFFYEYGIIILNDNINEDIIDKDKSF
ncbi:hypothetical protein RhiirA5_418461 [Rhizophagus irregularis]|uniref:Uncharacterized protein n=1 Tax=Rhizophagus irregularis TaxID=588596 RepID=A0A2N0PK67_9GLOM|nr:hypothetical protein RhiirA5_418461 [Rhizophagus irregularis]